MKIISEMEFVNISEVPQIQGDISSIRAKEILEHRIKEIIIKKIYPFDNSFRDFWLFCENPIPFVYRDFKYKNRFIITRDQQKIKDGEKMGKKETSEMVFVSVAEVPKASRGKKAKDWIAIFSKIPVGKAWTPKETDYGASTLRKAIEELVKSEKAKAEEFTVVQRTTNGETKTYVSHNEV